MFKLLAIDKGISQETRAAWAKQIEARAEDVLASHYERILDWADKYANGTGDKYCYVYGLVRNDGSKHACAVLEISHARPRSKEPYLKVLSVYLEPNLDLGDEDKIGAVMLGEIGAILAYSLTESLRLTVKEHPSTVLKVYARSDYAKGFFEALTAQLMQKGSIPGLNLVVQGRWLVFNKE